MSREFELKLSGKTDGEEVTWWLDTEGEMLHGDFARAAGMLLALLIDKLQEEMDDFLPQDFFAVMKMVFNQSMLYKQEGARWEEAAQA